MRPSLSEGSTVNVWNDIGEKRAAYRSAAENWVGKAVEAGCNPYMRQEPLSSEGLAGEWLLAVSAAGISNPLYPGRIPDDLLDEVFHILGQHGRIQHAQGLRPWHGNVLLDDTSPRALLFRTKLIREALSLSCDDFYGIMGLPNWVNQDNEGGQIEFSDPDDELLQSICLHYDVPEEWLTCGAAEEIVACPPA
jgi:hypothetical protein